MYTRCPGCGSVFEIDEPALLECAGDVECGVCNARFDANQSLAESADAFTPADSLDDPDFHVAEEAREAVADATPADAPALDEAVDLPIPEDETVFDELLEDMDEAEAEEERQSELPLSISAEEGAGSTTPVMGPLPGEAPPMVAEQAAPVFRPHRWSVHAGIAGLLLVLQLVAAIRVQLGDDTAVIADQAIAPTPWQLVERTVRPHPDRADALVLHVVIRNASVHAVDYPDLRLELTDTASKPIAVRTFSPDRYLQAADKASKLGANALLPVTLAIARPQRSWGGFQVQLLPHQ